MVRMEISPRDLRDTEIHNEMRGYNRDEVNELLERAASTIDSLNARVNQMQERLTSAQSEAGRTRETEDILHRTLLLAQRAADEAVAEATAKSRQMLDDAEMQSRRLVADAEAEARRKGESERRRLEEEILDLAGRRDALLADVEAMTRFEAEYRERMTRALEADLSAMRTRPTTAPGQKPEPTDVDLPVMPEAIMRPEMETSQPVSTPTAPVYAETVFAEPVYNEPRSVAAEASQPVEAIQALDASQPVEAIVTDPVATHEVDVRSLFEQARTEADAAAETTPAESAPLATNSMPGLQPIDLLGTDGADADVLDDDAFFATLRDAVHDDAPLGPREEGDEITGDHRFFDQDADRGSFRDVFRRRR
jgi:cell division initiation protein